MMMMKRKEFYCRYVNNGPNLFYLGRFVILYIILEHLTGLVLLMVFEILSSTRTEGLNWLAYLVHVWS